MAAPKILIPFYSRSGTVAGLAEAVAEGARAEGAEVRLRRAREVVPAEVIASVPGWKEGADALNAKYDREAPLPRRLKSPDARELMFPWLGLLDLCALQSCGYQHH